MGNASDNRKHKRSTTQIKPLKWVLVAASLLFIFVFVGGFVVYLQVQSYLKSDAFRDQIINLAENKLHADIDLDQLRWDGSTVYADGWHARGYPDSFFSSMKMDGLRALFNGTDNSAWQIPEIRINQLSFIFSEDRLPVATNRGSEFNNPPKAISRWLKKWVPDRADINVIGIDATNMIFQDSQGNQKLAISSVETTSRPMTAPGTWEIHGRNGELLIHNLPPMTVRKLETRWNGDEIFINQAALDFYDSAELTGTGDIKMGSSPELNLDLQLQNLETKKILSTNWKSKISGSLHGDIFISGNPKDKAPLKAKGTLQLKDGAIEGLPMLDLIAEYTKMKRFKRLALHKTHADFVKMGNRLEFSNIVLQSDGLTRLEGDLILEERKIIKGEFLLGVTPGTLSWIPGAEQKVFTNSKNGFLWTPLVITGTLDEPHENLSARLRGAAVDTLVNDAPKQATDAAKEILKNPSEAIDKGKKLIDSLLPLLK